MKWLKRVLQRWLEIEPRAKVISKYELNGLIDLNKWPGVKLAKEYNFGKCVGVKSGQAMNR